MPKQLPTTEEFGALPSLLLGWYRAHRRALPFREQGAGPYHVWVSEIMGQQTRMAALVPYYSRFVAALPSMAALAAADEETLHKLWEGLGYYSRVRHMQEAARIVMRQYGGSLPADASALRALPGIGEYTAGAIASIAFGQAVPAVDGNVLRVCSRLLACKDDISRPQAKKAITRFAAALVPAQNPGDFNQALMELGALLCLPHGARCGECPLGALCRARQMGVQDTLPRRAPKKPPAPQTYTVLVVRRGDGAVLLQRRPPAGLLAGLWQPPLLPGALTQAQAGEALARLMAGCAAVSALPRAKHVFTHRVWHMTGFLCTAPPAAAPPGERYVFALPEELDARYAVPGAFKAYGAAMRGGPA